MWHKDNYNFDTVKEIIFSGMGLFLTFVGKSLDILEKKSVRPVHTLLELRNNYLIDGILHKKESSET